MADRIELMMARRVDVFRVVAVRRRLVVACGLTLACVSAMGLVAMLPRGAGMPFVGIALLGVLLSYLWAVIETTLLQRAMRESRMVQAAVFVGMLTPVAAPFLAFVLLAESFVVVRIARRLRKQQCGRCGYDLRGITSLVCPECGWEMGVGSA